MKIMFWGKSELDRRGEDNGFTGNLCPKPTSDVLKESRLFSSRREKVSEIKIRRKLTGCLSRDSRCVISFDSPGLKLGCKTYIQEQAHKRMVPREETGTIEVED